MLLKAMHYFDLMFSFAKPYEEKTFDYNRENVDLFFSMYICIYVYICFTLC